MSKRLFFACSISDEVREELKQTQEQLRKKLRGDDIRWVEPDTVHLTIQFLGDVQQPGVGGLVEAMNRECSKTALPQCSLDSISGFPNQEQVRVLVVRVKEEDPQPLAKLGKTLRSTSLLFAPESDQRAWSPHLTLARFRETRALPHLSIPQLRWRTHCLLLMESTLTPSGPRYQVLHQSLFAS